MSSTVHNLCYAKADSTDYDSRLMDKGVYIVSARRTPFGTFGGKLKDVTSTDLALHAAKSAIDCIGVDSSIVDSVISGNALSATQNDGMFQARHLALKLGMPHSTSCYTVNRLCGSGLQAVVGGVQEILLGDSEIVLTVGAENMSQSPYILRGSRFGAPKFGMDLKLEDYLWVGLFDTHANMSMGQTGEKLAEQYQLTRTQCDEFAMRSQQKWRTAQTLGHFDAEIAPIQISTKKGEDTMATDEHPRETTLDKLSALNPVFKKDGVITAGTASGICDGASAVLLASDEACKTHNLTALSKIVSYCSVGCDPTIMGIGAAYALQGALKKAKLQIDDMEIIEVNEAFAAQTLAVMAELRLDASNTNVNGGAIAIGHPIGASGSRLIGHVTHELRRRKGKYGACALCIGGGQGIAAIVENTDYYSESTSPERSDNPSGV